MSSDELKSVEEPEGKYGLDDLESFFLPFPNDKVQLVSMSSRYKPRDSDLKTREQHGSFQTKNASIQNQFQVY